MGKMHHIAHAETGQLARYLNAAVIGLLFFSLAPTALASAPAHKPLHGLWRLLQQSPWIAVGSARPDHVVYAFIDPNCPFCHQLWLDLPRYYGQGLQVRTVLVDVIADSSPGKAAAILEAGHPAAALQENENLWGHRSDGGGGIAPLRNPESKVIKELAADDALMLRFGIYGTPGLVFADRTGTVHVIAGLPDGTSLAEIVYAATAATSPRRHKLSQWILRCIVTLEGKVHESDLERQSGG